MKTSRAYGVQMSGSTVEGFHGDLIYLGDCNLRNNMWKKVAVPHQRSRAVKIEAY